jgi:chemotaxis protein CheD
MEEIPIEVQTGVVTAAAGGVLRASAVGSCVVVVVYDPEIGVGGLAHVMLPGPSPAGRDDQRTRYAEDGILQLIRDMTALGAQPERLVACIAGGGNVLERDDDTLCQANVSSVIRILEEGDIRLNASEVGGTKRRSISLDVGSGRISYTVGESAPKLLWRPGGGKQEGDDDA